MQFSLNRFSFLSDLVKSCEYVGEQYLYDIGGKKYTTQDKQIMIEITTKKTKSLHDDVTVL